MKKERLLILLIFFSSIGFSQILVPKKDYIPEVRQSRYSFAISLITGGNSSPVSFGIMRQNPDSTHEVIFLTKGAFIRQASAGEISKANPNKINFFEEYGIDPKILDELWKLKHDKYPYDRRDELGWGTGLGVPTERQFNMLKEFGLSKMTDYTYGEDVWHFLIKVSDPVWIGQYQNSN